MSKTGNNRLVQTAPAITELFSATNTPLSAFEDRFFTDMFLEVTRQSDNEVMSCDVKNNCLVRYHWDYTPRINYLIPQVVYPGMISSIMMSVKATTDYRKEGQQFIDIRFDGTSVSYDNGVTTSIGEGDFMEKIARGSHPKLAFTQNSEQRNAQSQVTAFFRAAGYAMHESTV